MLLAGDLGGTKTNLAIFHPTGSVRNPVAEGSRPSGDFPSLDALVADFLQEHRYPITSAAFGVAGPVNGNTAEITNLSWYIDADHLAKELNFKSVCLLNDLEAFATSIPTLNPADLYTIYDHEPEPGGAIAVIAPGTGLGEGYLTWDGKRYRASPSEGGHADFAPTTTLQDELLLFLRGKFEHVSYERVCSGSGIPNLYDFFKARDGAPADFDQQVTAAEDPTAFIMQAARSPNSPAIATAVLDLFVDILASEAGNLALKILATGGVYLGGGIPPRLRDVLTAKRFLPLFRRKGRLSAVLERMSVRIIVNPKAGLLGAAIAAQNLEE